MLLVFQRYDDLILAMRLLESTQTFLGQIVEGFEGQENHVGIVGIDTPAQCLVGIGLNDISSDTCSSVAQIGNGFQSADILFSANGLLNGQGIKVFTIIVYM